MMCLPLFAGELLDLAKCRIVDATAVGSLLKVMIAKFACHILCSCSSRSSSSYCHPSQNPPSDVGDPHGVI
jgi:hypothetical protein